MEPIFTVLLLFLTSIFIFCHILAFFILGPTETQEYNQVIKPRIYINRPKSKVSTYSSDYDC